MTLVAKHLPNLSGGISKQEASLRLYNQCEEQINLRPSLVNGLENRAPLIYKASHTQKDGAFYPIDRDSDGRYNLLINQTGLYITTENGTQQTVSNLDPAYLTAETGNPYDIYKVLTLADSTYILNTRKTVTMLGDRYTAWQNQALVFIKQVSAATTWTLNINGGSYSVGYGGSNTDTGLPDLYVNGAKAVDDVSMSATDIASRLASGFAHMSIQQKGAVLYIRAVDGSAFTIGLEDTRSGTCSNLITTQVQQFDQLPTTAPDGYIARVIGSVSSNADDYYVMFQTNNGDSFSKGVWKECAEPGSLYGLSPATMPHILIHNANGSWTFKPAEWAEKETGDLDSSPNPSFVDKNLRNIFLYSNRLCFLTADLLCMSAAADHTNWWNETATSITDADPVFISASTEKIADLYDFGVLDDDLILFGKEAQYRLNTSDVLSPKTAAITAIGKNIYTKATGITASGAKLYFGHKNGNAFTVNEFGTSSVTGNKEAVSITMHVPGLIPYNERIRVAGTENTDTIAVISAAQQDTIYMYQYYISGTNKLQSAWHKYTINGKIKGHFFRENQLWLYIEKTETTAITATLDTAETTEQTENQTILDLAVTLTAETATAQWTIPTGLNPEKVTVLTKTADGLKTPVVIQQIQGQTITLMKKVTEITVGEKIYRKYIFSPPYVTSKQKDGGEKTQIAGRFQLQKLLLNVGTSGTFTVNVRPKYDDTQSGYSYIYSGIITGSKSAIAGQLPVSAGEFTIPLRGRNTDIEVTITSDTHLPQSIISAIWQGNYITKVTSI